MPEEAACTAADQRGAEATLAVFARSGAGPAGVVAPSLLIVVSSSIRIGRVGARRRVVGRQVTSLLIVSGRRRPPRRGKSDVGVGRAGACVLRMRRVGREVAAGLLCVLRLRRVRGRRVAVLRLWGVLVLGWVGAARTAASTTAVVVVCS